MKRKIGWFIFTVLVLNSFGINAQLTPNEAILQMGRGINVGNTMEATPTEGSWGNFFQKYFYDDYASAGFTCIRIPITWKFHVQKNSPYTINQKWLARIDTVVTWGLNKGLYIIINAHHEVGLKGIDTMKNLTAKADTFVKYDSIWSQIATHFKDKSDHLLFEILNEPDPMSEAMVDSFNSSVLRIIRKTNPTRIVLYSGNQWSRAAQLEAAKIPNKNDKYLIGYYHPYDPSNFVLNAVGTYGSTSDINTTIAAFNQIESWSKTNNIPVTANEMGAENACDYNSRMIYYATMVEQAISNGQSFNVWDDNGSFATYLRSARKWDDSKDVIIHTYKESPTQLKALVTDTTVSLSWLNRASLNDSIYLDRRTATTVFTSIAKLSPTASQFHDSALKMHTVYYYRLRTKRLPDSVGLYSYPIAATIIGVRKPFLGYPVEVPGTIQAENYDIGGEGQTYHDIDAKNKGGAYRLTEGVDIEARIDSGYQICYVADGEWTQYSIHVNQSGLYQIINYTASPNGGGKYNFTIGNISTSSVSVPKTGDSMTLAASSTLKVPLDSGNQILTFHILLGTSYTFYIDRFVIIHDTSKSAITNQNLANDFLVYPNPAGSKIIIQKQKSNTPSKLEVYNILGLKMKTEVLNDEKNVISLDDIGNGVYIFVLKSEDSFKTVKVVIKH